MISEFQKYFHETILHIRRVEHKGNNQLFNIITNEGNYILKRYSIIQKDNWDRGKTEFRAISLLWHRGFEVPKPFDLKDGIGIYSFETGRALNQNEVSKKDIIYAADFIARLHNISLEDKKEFPLERTACLTFLDYIALIENRYKNIREDFMGGKKEKDFLEGRVYSKIQEIKKIISLQDIQLGKQLTLEEQVVTPGDFGFHNILVNSGKYIFLDFEYCGRDDPAKQILDFLHHDKTRELSRGMKNVFIKKYLERFPCFNIERMKLVDPLIGINWVLIYLNPLSKKYLEHMHFSYGKNMKSSEIIEKRIQKASIKLDNLYFFNQE